MSESDGQRTTEKETKKRDYERIRDRKGHTKTEREAGTDKGRQRQTDIRRVVIKSATMQLLKTTHSQQL